MLPPAVKTGRLTVVPNAMAREVTTDASGLATGVSYVNTETLAEHRGSRAHRRARGQLLRVGAAPAELEVLAFPEWTRELERRRRQVPDRLDRPQRQRLHPGAGRFAALQLGRLRRRAPLHARGGATTGASGFPRGYHIEL